MQNINYLNLNSIDNGTDRIENPCNLEVSTVIWAVISLQNSRADKRIKAMKAK